MQMNQTWFLKYILLFTLFYVFGITGFAQSLLEKRFVIALNSGSTGELLKSIEDEANISFSYSNKLCLKEYIQLSSNKNTLKGFIDEIFSDCQYQLSEKRNKIIITPLTSDAKQKFVIRGFVKSKKDGEILIGSNVYDANQWVGTSSNNFGFYSLTLPGGDVLLNCSYVGYNSIQHYFKLEKDTVINFSLEYNSLIKEIPVVSFLTPEGINSTRTSTINLPVSQIKKVPSFLGEIDVARTLQLLPGINGGSEGVSGLYVRGGGTDQNLFLIDDVPVYNISHLFGFFSVFNEDAINNVTVTKGGFPARYGGRLSSVVDIRLKDGNNERIHGSVSVGMMSSKLALDGPLYKEKTTYSISFRRSYYDLLALPIQSGRNSRTGFYFYDSNAKISHKFSDKSRMYLSYYGGRDRFYTKYDFMEVINPNQPQGGQETIDVNNENYSGWGNTVASLRWNKIYNQNLFSNISLAYSDYSYFVGHDEHNIESNIWNFYQQKYYSGITDVMSKIDFDYFLNPDHHLRFGGNFIIHTFNPGLDIIRESFNLQAIVDSTIGGVDIQGNELYYYLENDFNLTSDLKINAGLHASLYNTRDKLYSSYQPRLSLRYLILPKFAIKASFSKMTQYLHLVTSSSVSLPTDLWIPVTNIIKPQHAKQYSIGGKLEFRKGFDMSLMGYYKNYENLLTYDERASSTVYTDSWENNFLTGSGNARGVELLIHKKTGKLSGWMGYTLAESRQRFDKLNGGRSFPGTNDRRHDIGVFGNYVINSKIDVSATWLFSSGSSVTLPSQKYYTPSLPTQGMQEQSSYSEYISTKNGYKMPVFHRLDIGVNLRKPSRWGESVWSFGLYNAYGRQNAFTLYFSSETNERTGQVSRELRQLSIFPFPLPYVRYTLKF